MQSLVYDVFICLMIIFALLMCINLIVSIHAHKLRLKYGAHYKEDNFNNRTNSNSLVTIEYLKENNIDDTRYRYIAKSYYSDEKLIAEGIREKDQITNLDQTKTFKTFKSVRTEKEPTEDLLREQFYHLKDIDEIATVSLNDGFHVLFLVEV